MSNKIDKRVIRTRKLLFQALVDLIAQKGYNAISIKDITDQAGIGRSTFYAHFENKEQLLFSEQNLIFQQLFDPKHGFQKVPTSPLLQTIMNHIYENKNMSKTILSDESGTLMTQKLHTILVSHFREKAKETILIDTDLIDLFGNAFAASIIGLVKHWIIHLNNYPPSFIADQSLLLFHNYITLLKKQTFDKNSD